MRSRPGAATRESLWRDRPGELTLPACHAPALFAHAGVTASSKCTKHVLSGICCTMRNTNTAYTVHLNAKIPSTLVKMLRGSFVVVWQAGPQPTHKAR